MALNLDDLIGSMQSVHAGDRGQGIEEIRENLRLTLGQSAMGPLQVEGYSSASGSGAMRINGRYGRYDTGASGSGSSAAGTAKKRRMLNRNGYPQPHHHAHPPALHMRQRPHYSSPSHSRSRERARGGSGLAFKDSIEGQHSDLIDGGEDAVGDSTMTGEDGAGTSYFSGSINRNSNYHLSNSGGDYSIPYPSPVNGLTSTHTQRLPSGAASAADMALSPATSSYPRSYTSNTSSSGAGPSSFASTSASSHSAAGSSGFYGIGNGAAPPANTPQQTPSDRDDTALLHRVARPDGRGEDLIWEGSEDVEGEAAVGASAVSDIDVLDEEEPGPVSKYLASPPNEARGSGGSSSGGYDLSRPASSSPKKLVNGFTPTLLS
ncbi:hypothetical protein BCV69DRAFT_313956 [Microstroma glucosiphilum]|uniref:Uncharacterized protein n=1 Tax=Pseudomicrostroma glucosiphilum TaxID=1684307 RepID=A0A316U1F0_9BASI|nr:hypothetical protein BCV69DRAFT_313956 [Pseudomicrostroma glucosiphilum]PWN19209.1 hypothetical protein BCV69DRAFT_313956 [Pseudomicrostroma glucosiphilum]